MGELQINLTLTALTLGILPKRRILTLNAHELEIPIGRASKTISKGLLGAGDNGWFDSPVMSRNHAKLSLDKDSMTVTIQDVNSTHGTLLNNIEVPPMEPLTLNDGDTLIFGTEIRRHDDVFPACKFKVNYEIIPWSSKTSSTFEVPYSSDIEEDQASSVEGDDKNADSDGETPAESPVPKASSLITETIDLTREDSELAAVCGIDLTADTPEVPESVSQVSLEKPVIDLDEDSVDGNDHYVEEIDSDLDLHEIDNSEAESEEEFAENEFDLDEILDSARQVGMLQDDYNDQADMENRSESFPPGADSIAVDAQAFDEDAWNEETNPHICSTYASSSNDIVRRPSPSDAAMVKSLRPSEPSSGAITMSPTISTINPITVHYLPQQQWRMQAQKSLAEKANKAAYFAAREVNGLKLQALDECAADIRNSANFMPVFPFLRGNEWFAPSRSRSSSSNPPEPSAINPAEKPSVQRNLLKSQTVVEDAEPSRSVNEPDMTSAVTFNRTNIHINRLTAVRGYQETLASLEPSVEASSRADKGSSKRKADAISDVLEGEVRAWASSQALEETVTSMNATSESTTAEAATLEERPPKRYKKLAEALSYFALGGAAVGVGLFSVLVATAPEFL